MAIFRKVHTEFWNDPKVLEEMTPEDKYFFLYLLTNSSTTQIGIYQISKKTMAFELGYSMESINALMDRFIKHHKSIRYNSETRELAIRNWGKYNLDRAGKPMEDCVRAELERVKDESLIEYVGEFAKSPKLKALYDTYTIRSTSGHTLSTQEEEEEEEEEEEKEEEEEGRIVSDNNFKELVQTFEQNGFGTISNHVRESLVLLSDEYTEIWVLDAMKVAVDRNVRNLRYTEGILKKWKAEGKDDGHQEKKKPTVSGMQIPDERKEVLRKLKEEQKRKESGVNAEFM